MIEVKPLNLWNWYTSVVLQTTSGSTTVYLRTLGGLQDEQRVDAALAASMSARAELENPSSKIHQNHIAPLLSLDKSGLKEVVISLQRGLFIREARWRIEPYGDPDAPEEILDGIDVLSKPDLNDILDWKDEQGSLRGELERRRKEWVDQQIEVLEEELEDADDLQDRAIDLHKAAIVERAYNKEWDWQTVFFGSFKDVKCKKPFFENVQEVRDLPRSKFLHIAAAYMELDTFSRNPEALKNSS